MGQQSLKESTIIHNRYEIQKMIGNGGFGITYIALDLELKQRVVIKEYFPWTLADRNVEAEEYRPVVIEDKRAVKLYQKGKKDFIAEARRMSELFDVQAIVKILDYFEENDTAYLVMEYIQGITLEEYLECREVPMDFAQAWTRIKPIVEALEQVHKKGLIHRDINPSNLIVTEDGSLRLIDFGAARRYLDNEKTMTILVKRGYAPPEQYAKKEKQGPWTDVYAVCATLYEMVTGVRPEPSIHRMVKDELYLPSSYGVVITPEEEQALAKGLEPDSKKRIRNMRELLAAVCYEETKGKPEKIKKKKTMRGMSVAFVIIIIGILAGSITWQFHKGEEAISYAGNYRKGTDKYNQFAAFVQEHAIAKEVQTTDDNYEMERNNAVIYTLPQEAVVEWGEPGNTFRFFIKKEELLEKLKKQGYNVKNAREEVKNIVEIQCFGGILTRFIKTEDYEIKEKVWLRLESDSLNQDVISIALSVEKGNEDRLAEAGADILKGVLKGLDISRERILSEFRESENYCQSTGFSVDRRIYTAETEECTVYIRPTDEDGYECWFKPFEGISAKYYWP